MAKKTLYLGVILIGGYALYRLYKKRNQETYRSGTIEYVYEKPQNND